MKVFTAQQMRDFDRAAIEDYGIPSIVLMENAALRVVEFLEAKFAPLSGKKIVVLCGKGNNGGDGLAIARHLSGVSRELTVAMEEIEDYKGDAAVNRRILEPTETQPQSYHNSWPWSIGQFERPFEDVLRDCDVVVDALFGTGFRGGLPPLYANAFFLTGSHGKPYVHVDIASGLNSDNGEGITDLVLHTGPRFTVSFAAPKRGFFVGDGLKESGEVWIGDIGTLRQQMEDTQTGVSAFDLETAKQFLPRRPIDAHKGDAGRALIVGGSLGMSGSICLASRAALATGAGLVSAAVPEKVLPIYATAVLEAVSHPLPNDESGHLLERAADELPKLWKEVQVVALGPGLGRTPEAFAFARRVARECPVPLVIDADALHALPAIADDVKARKAPTILTPHPGEMGVLMDTNAKEVNDARFETVRACAQKYGAIVVLKGARTLVCDSDGEIWVNLTGNPGMATGGAGDVLTGTIAGLLAQLKDADAATKLGVYLHGMAGDLAAQTRGNGLVAGDIAAHLPAALLEIRNREVERINGRLRKLE